MGTTTTPNHRNANHAFPSALLALTHTITVIAAKEMSEWHSSVIIFANAVINSITKPKLKNAKNAMEYAPNVLITQQIARDVKLLLELAS
jgi:hypothetical protein